ncbi:MAG: argininosuccinate lyase [Chloroflexota bacterium]
MSYLRGRFQKAAAQTATEYTSSLPFDWILYRYDITGSIAHARMLAKQGIISEDEAGKIVEGLEAVREEIELRKFRFLPDYEDIHMAIEARLGKLVGEVAGKLRTARSRNDQVALDLRLFTREAIINTVAAVTELQGALVAQAEAHRDAFLPGYTHLQAAQPVLLAHHLLAYFEMLRRDTERFHDCLQRTDVLPSGSGALAGVPYPVDREFLAKELGFSEVSRNSMDAVSDRDFILEYEAAAAVCMMHLSRLAEEIVLWTSERFRFVDIDDAYATGSSIMPQKKNPDVAELARGKTGRVYGNLMAMLSVMKGLPLAYNRDLQEDKEGFFDTVDTLLTTLEVMAGMVDTMTVNEEKMRQAVVGGYLLATDLADYLVKKGLAFRRAHEAVAKLVSYAAEQGKSFAQLSIEEYHQFSKRFDDDVFTITVAASLAARDVTGGTAPPQVAKALAAARKMLGKKK